MSDLNQLFTDIVADGVIDSDEVTQIESVIYADGQIDAEEADFMFRLNDAVTGKDNDDGWQALFVRSLTDYVLADETSPGEVDADEANYLIEKIGNDGQVDEAELALLVNITAQATACTDEFNAYVLEALYQAVIADGVIDDDEVAMIKTVIYGSGGGGGEAVDRDEAEFLFKLNDACSGQDNCAGWSALFVEAISSHVLEDDESPNEIDADEAEFLIEAVLADGQVDDVERALLVNIKAKATAIDASLADKMAALGI